MKFLTPAIKKQVRNQIQVAGINFLKNAAKSIVRRGLIQLEMYDYEPGFGHAVKYLSEHVIDRRFSLSGAQNGRLGSGKHFGAYAGVPAMVDYVRSGSEGSDKFVITFLTTNWSVVDMFSADTKEGPSVKEGHPQLSLYANRSGSWDWVGNIQRRALSSVFLPQGVTDRIVRHISEWRARVEWNSSRGLPSHTGILFHGEPGTAKTSLIHAIASHFGMGIHNIDLSTVYSSAEFIKLLNSGGRDVVYVIEDIDASGAAVKARSEFHKDPEQLRDRISTAGILAGLDSFMTPPGMLLIATTNHIDHIDPAILRAGRFDLKIEVPRMTKVEFEKMALHYEMDPAEYTLDTFVPMTGADVRALLLEGGVAAVQKFQELRSGDTPMDTSAATAQMFPWKSDETPSASFPKSDVRSVLVATDDPEPVHIKIPRTRNLCAPNSPSTRTK